MGRNTLRDALTAAQLTQAEFAARLGVGQSAVSNWLNGTRQIKAERVLDIEKLLAGHVTRHDLRPDLYPPE